MKFKLFLMIFTFVFLINLVSALNLGNLSLFPNPGTNYAGSNIQYSFNFTNSTNCSTANNLLSITKFIQIDSRGVGFISIDLSSLKQVPTSLCEGREGILRKQHNFSSVVFRSIATHYLNVSSNAIIKGRLNVTGNITAGYFKGSINWSDVQNAPGGLFDTNESTRFNALVTTDCSPGELVIGIESNGSVLCAVDAGSFTNTNLAYVNETNNFTADQNFTGNTLTGVGELLLEGYLRVQNLTPITTNLYSLGNSTNWFNQLFVRTINTVNINTSNLNATDIKSEDIESDRINTSNITVGGYNISVSGGNLVIDIG